MKRVVVTPVLADRCGSVRERGVRADLASSAAWMCVILMVVRITLLVRQRPGGQFAAIDGYALMEILLVGLSCMVVAISSHVRKVTALLSASSLGCLLVFYLVGVASSAWSALPEYSLYRAAQVLSQVLLICVALAGARMRCNAERDALLISFVIILFGIGATLKLSGMSISASALHTNGYTGSAVIVLCYCIGELAAGAAYRRKWLSALLVACFLLVLLGTSRGSLVALGVGLVVTAVVTRTRGALLAAAAYIAVVAGIVYYADQIGAKYGEQLHTQEIVSLGGREWLWRSYLDLYMDRPFVGYGFAVAARVNDVHYTTNTHNSLLSAALGTGVLGLVPFAIAFILLGKELLTACAARQIGSCGCAASLAAGFTNSMSRAYVGEGWMDTTAVFVAIWAYFVLYVRVGRGEQVLFYVDVPSVPSATA